MSRLSTRFQSLEAAGEKALVTYVTVGDPDLATSAQVLDTLARAGADVLELGVPFSDPTADGPTIQRSSLRALQAGTNVAKVLELVHELRRTHDTPAILFGYFNPFLQYGLEKLARDAAEAGVDGFLVVDLPPEEADEFHGHCRAHGLDLIYLLTPTSDERRMAAVRDRASGFVYYVSRTGVTGAATENLGDVNAQIAAVKAAMPLPVCVGFGIATPDQVSELRAQADGVVVGSAIVNRVEAIGAGTGTIEELERYVRSLKAPLRAPVAR